MSRQSRERTLGWTIALGLALLACGPSLAQQCPNLVWSDEFGGSAVDETNWSFQIGDGCSEGICGWGNNELQSYQAENAEVSGGTLKIIAKRERIRNKQFTSARIRSLGKRDFFFGRFEARIKVPTGQGMWPAFWMLPTDEVFGGWPQSGEIDIMENIGSAPSTVFGTIHYGDPFPNNQSQGATYTFDNAALADDFHVFAVEKEAGEIRWFVDDILYSVKTPSDIAPFSWPFDERFHFLLNLAVGGNFPGDPDGTTVFPQTYEIDYVRVWDGNFQHITGDHRVPNRASGVVYALGNVPGGASVSWTAPADATIVSGQGTSSITVDFGDLSGAVAADVTGGCGSPQLAIDVVVEPPLFFDFTLENFDDPPNATRTFSTGTLAVVANPDPSGVNTTATVAEYTRNSAEQFDVLVYSTSVIADASDYVNGLSKLRMDVLTQVPAGTEILVQLEDSNQTTPDNFPTGRHSRFQAVTSGAASWERLEFDFLDRPDAGASDTAVDTIVVLFATNSFTGDVYHYDNFDSFTTTDPGDPPPPPPPPATTMHVDSIVSGTQGVGKGQKQGVATVVIVDNNGNPVHLATVDGTFSGTINETASGTTGGGSVTLTTTGTAGGNVQVTFCVDDVTHGTLAYDPASNNQSCG